jgi:hypothetical protein
MGETNLLCSLNLHHVGLVHSNLYDAESQRVHQLPDDALPAIRYFPILGLQQVRWVKCHIPGYIVRIHIQDSANFPKQ